MERPSDVWPVQTLVVPDPGKVSLVEINTGRVGRSDQTDKKT